MLLILDLCKPEKVEHLKENHIHYKEINSKAGEVGYWIPISHKVDEKKYAIIRIDVFQYQPTPKTLNFATRLLSNYVDVDKRKYIDRFLICGDVVQIKNKFVNTAKRSFNQGITNYVNMKFDNVCKLPIFVKDLSGVDFVVTGIYGDSIKLSSLDNCNGGILSIRLDKEFLILSKEHNKVGA